VVTCGGYPGARQFWKDEARLRAYLRDAIVEPAIGRDILQLEHVRKPALLRQIFALAMAHPAEILSLEKMAGSLAEKGALETIAHYLDLLKEAYLVAPVPKWSGDEIRRRKSPPKLIALNNGLLLGGTSLPAPEPQTDPSRWGRWLENACLGPCLERRAARALLEGGTLGGGRGHPGRLGTVDRRGEDRTLHGGRSQGPRRRHNKISRILSLGHLRPRRGGASRGRRIPFHPLARLPAWRPESRTKRLGSGGMKTTAGPY
jgi:hypothetical protein